MSGRGCYNFKIFYTLDLRVRVIELRRHLFDALRYDFHLSLEPALRVYYRLAFWKKLPYKALFWVV